MSVWPWTNKHFPLHPFSPQSYFQPSENTSCWNWYSHLKLLKSFMLIYSCHTQHIMCHTGHVVSWHIFLHLFHSCGILAIRAWLFLGHFFHVQPGTPYSAGQPLSVKPWLACEKAWGGTGLCLIQIKSPIIQLAWRSSCRWATAVWRVYCLFSSGAVGCSTFFFQWRVDRSMLWPGPGPLLSYTGTGE